MRDNQKEFPWLYHAHHSMHNEDLPFWLELVAQMGGPVLELACGSGRVLVPIAQAGYITIGLDRDASMLAALQINLQRSPKSTVYLLLADLAAFRLDTQFPFILIACNTLSTLQAPVR